MPSQLHEVLILLFRNRPELAADLLRDALRVELPPYTETRVESADLSEALPTQYHADHVVLLIDEGPVLGIIVEVQLRPDESKPFVWPMYVAGLRARLKCPVCLLVLTVSERAARWAARPIDLGGGNFFSPLVIGSTEIPEVTDEAKARADPELAVLSVMAHGKGLDTDKALRVAQVALAASTDLDPQRATMYGDLVFQHCSEHVCKELLDMDPAKYEYQSDFAKRYFAEGRSHGEVTGRQEGHRSLILRQLAVRFGPLSEQVRARIAEARIEELETIGERLLTAPTLQEALSGLRESN